MGGTVFTRAAQPTAMKLGRFSVMVPRRTTGMGKDTWTGISIFSTVSPLPTVRHSGRSTGPSPLNAYICFTIGS